MATFDEGAFIRKHAFNKKNRVKTPSGRTLKMEGLPEQYTDAEIVAHTSRQAEVKGTEPKVETEGGLTAGGSFTLKGETAAQLLIGITGIGAQSKGKNRLPERVDA